MMDTIEQRPLANILVVEDDEAQRHTVCDILRQEGFEPIACADASEALESARREVQEAANDVAGPLARAAEDLQLALDVLSGPLPDAATAWRLELPPPRHERLSDFRVAAWLEEPGFPVDDEVRERHEATLDALREAGFAVEEVKAQPVEALVAEWSDFLCAYHEGVLGWAGGCSKVEEEGANDDVREAIPVGVARSSDRMAEEPADFAAALTSPAWESRCRAR